MNAADDEVRVLLVGDASTLREYRRKLEEDAYDVTVARSEEAWWREARSHSPDLVVLNITPPEMHGLAALAQLRADSSTRHIPVVILSEATEAELREHGLMLGAQDHLIRWQPAAGTRRPSSAA